MANDNGLPFECTCATSPSCSDAPHCMCIGFPDPDDEMSGACICTCSFDPVTVKARSPLDKPATLNTKGVDLARLGEFIGKVADAEILVPAADLKKPIEVTLKGATLGEIIEQVGLVARGRDGEASAA